LRYDELRNIEVKDGSFYVNGECWLRGTSNELLALQQSVQVIAQSADRPAAIRRQIRNGLAAGTAAAEQIETVEKRIKRLAVICSVYAVWLLLLTPLFIVRYPACWILLWSTAVPLLIFHLLCGTLFLRAHRALIADAAYARREAFCKMLLCPPMMIRACDSVTSQVRIAGDAAAVLMACAQEVRWRPEIQGLWRRLIYAKFPHFGPDIAQVLGDFTEFYRAEFAEFLRSKNINPSVFEVDPSRIPEGRRCCPCCETLYSEDVSLCCDCGSVELLNPVKG
jgi:hypothetical protein